MVVRPSLVAVAALSSACSFEGAFGEGYRCGEGGRCPDNQSCVNDYCVADPAPDDGGVDSDDGPAPRCGTLSALRDSFDDDSTGALWNRWADTGITTTETGGELVVDVPAGTGTGWGGYTSRYYYDLTEGVFDVEVNQAGGRYTNLEIRDPDGLAVQSILENGEVLAVVSGTADEGIRASITYDPDLHHYWRFREESGRLYWETSSDRLLWQRLHDEPLPFAPDHVRGIVSGGGQLATATSIHYGDVNAATPDPGFCPADTFVDGFDDGEITAGVWGWWSDAECSVVETGGVFRMTFTGVAEAWCGAETRHLFDATDSGFVLDIAGMPVIAGYLTYTQLRSPGADTYVEIGRDGAYLEIEQRIAGSTVTSYETLYDNDIRYWRIRGAGGQVYWDTSADGTTWNNVLQADAQLDLSAVMIELGAGQYTAGSIAPAVVDIAAVNP